jgi:hypothetical protein
MCTILVATVRRVHARSPMAQGRLQLTTLCLFTQQFKRLKRNCNQTALAHVTALQMTGMPKMFSWDTRSHGSFAAYCSNHDPLCLSPDRAGIPNVLVLKTPFDLHGASHAQYIPKRLRRRRVRRKAQQLDGHGLPRFVEHVHEALREARVARREQRDRSARAACAARAADALHVLLRVRGHVKVDDERDVLHVCTRVQMVPIFQIVIQQVSEARYRVAQRTHQALH